MAIMKRLKADDDNDDDDRRGCAEDACSLPLTACRGDLGVVPICVHGALNSADH